MRMNFRWFVHGGEPNLTAHDELDGDRYVRFRSRRDPAELIGVHKDFQFPAIGSLLEQKFKSQAWISNTTWSCSVRTLNIQKRARQVMETRTGWLSSWQMRCTRS